MHPFSPLTPTCAQGPLQFVADPRHSSGRDFCSKVPIKWRRCSPLWWARYMTCKSPSNFSRLKKKKKKPIKKYHHLTRSVWCLELQIGKHGLVLHIQDKKEAGLHVLESHLSLLHYFVVFSTKQVSYHSSCLSVWCRHVRMQMCSSMCAHAVSRARDQVSTSVAFQQLP